MHDLIQVAGFTAFFKCPAALLYALASSSTLVVLHRDAQILLCIGESHGSHCIVEFYDRTCEIRLRALILVSQTVYFAQFVLELTQFRTSLIKRCI